MTGMCIVVLDEIDQLLSRHQQVLYHLFELASAKGSRLILIGVANALDLTDRFLPRLAARGAMPRTITFTPYSNAELQSIIIQRVEPVERSDGSCLIDRAAVKLCAMKVAAASGDARRALEVCRVAADKALSELHTYDDSLLSMLLQPQPSQPALPPIYSVRPSILPHGKSPLSSQLPSQLSTRPALRHSPLPVVNQKGEVVRIHH